MKISNETKVGVLTITGLTILILGFNFLKGKDLFKKRKKIYAVFNDLGSLSKSNEVKINGYVIGSVYALNVKDKDMSGIVATISLTQDVNIPKDSKAMISTPLVGASYIVIQKGTGKDYLQPGDTLTTFVDVGILDDVKAQLTPTLTKVRVTLDSLNTVFGSVNGLLNSTAKNNLHETLDNLNKASNSLNSLLDKETGQLPKILTNAEAFTRSLNKDTANLSATIYNARKTSEKLAALELQPAVDSLKSMIASMKTAAEKMTNEKGTLGALMHDKTLYNKLKDAILSAEILLDDLRAHPKRYVGFSIFGRKDKTGPLNAPLQKDTTQK